MSYAASLKQHSYEDTSTAMVAPFIKQKAALLTTYRRSGEPVGTPVNVAVEGDHIFFRTWDTTGKFKRLRNNTMVELVPSTFRGKPTGLPIRARGRILSGTESEHAAKLLGHKYPILHGFLIPRLHRLQGNTTVHVELTPIEVN
jgi:uncharacterized protein